MNFFKNNKKFSNRQFAELVVLTGATVLLLAGALFVNDSSILSTISRNSKLALQNVSKQSQAAGTQVSVYWNYIYGSPSPIAPGKTTALYWQANRGDYCQYYGGPVGLTTVLGVTGSFVTPPLYSDTTFYIDCEDSGGANYGSTGWLGVVIPVHALSSTLNYFTVSPNPIISGSSGTMSWSINPDILYYGVYQRGGSWGGGVWNTSYPTASGSGSTGTITSSQTYYLDLYEYNGTTYAVYYTGTTYTTTAGVYVPLPPAPTCTLSAAPFMASGSKATLSYVMSGSPTGAAIDQGVGNIPLSPTSGSVQSAALTFNTTFTMTVTNAGGSNTCATAVAIMTPPVPTISASPTTVNPNATSSLTWSATGLASGQCTLTAHSSSGTATNFAALYNGGNVSSFYGAVFVIGNGYVYRLGGDNNGTFTTNAAKVPLSSDLTNIANWVGSTLSLPATFVAVSKPVVLNGTVYLFGGMQTNVTWTNNICTVPLASIESNAVGNWNCAAGTLPGAYALSDVVIIGDYLYRFGGYNPASGALTSVERARVSSPLSWVNYPAVLSKATYGSAVAVIGNYVYLFGGYNATDGVLGTIYRALITSDLTAASSWSLAGSLLQPVYQSAVAVDLNSNNVYLIGGYNTLGASVTTIQQATKASLAGGTPVWNNIAPATMIPEYYPQPLIVDDKLYIMGGWNTVGPSVVNKVLVLPFNDGLAYTSPAMLPWLTTGSPNVASTWPINAQITTYTLQCTNSAGTNSATATVNEPDLCTNNVLFPGIQNPLPNGVTASAGVCSCTTGTWNGSSCILSSPIISAPTISPLLTTTLTLTKRIKKGNSITLNWGVTGLTSGDAATSCSVSSNPPGAMTTQTWNHSGVAWSQVNNPISPININGTTVFTVSCTNAAWTPTTVSTSATVNLVPTFQEQ